MRAARRKPWHGGRNIGAIIHGWAPRRGRDEGLRPMALAPGPGPSAHRRTAEDALQAGRTPAREADQPEESGPQ